MAWPSQVLSIRFYVFSTSGNQAVNIDICPGASEGRVKNNKAAISIQRWPGWAMRVCPSSNQGRTRMKRDLGWMLKEFEVVGGFFFFLFFFFPPKNRHQKHYPCLGYREEQGKKSKNMNRYSEFLNTGIYVTFSPFFWKEQMLYLGNQFQILQIFS